MKVFHTPNWDKDSSSEKIWKDTFSLKKTSTGKVEKAQKDKLIKRNSKKKLRAKFKNKDSSIKKEYPKINHEKNNVDKLQVNKKQNPKKRKKEQHNLQTNSKPNNAINNYNKQIKSSPKFKRSLNKTVTAIKNKTLLNTKTTKTEIKLTKFKEKLKQPLIKDKVQLQLPQASRKSLKSMSLREKMMAKLKAAKFRYLNEQMYTSDGKTALQYFGTDPESYKAYHEGYQLQVTKWPLNPLDIIIRNIKRMPENFTVADFGCGEARLAKSVPQKVHSFDLVALSDDVQVCDMAHVPLENSSIDVVVFCLSLMGTNLKDYLLEANRVLKIGGIMKIAEVESRFDSVEEFIKKVKLFGFQFSRKDLSHNLFYFIDFKKKENTSKKTKLQPVNLKPCIYKKR